MADRILIRDLVARGVLGAQEDERKRPQEIVINLTLDVDAHLAGRTDDLKDALNYCALAEQVITYTERSRHRLVEALASAIAVLCLEHAEVQRVRVRVETPGVIRFARSVGVEITRTREDI
ncbi:MAG: dihydroneopterin aldolase [Anaerolineae bacterium]|jgi:FolB domain-containing protein|nr:dihydroneopterin aldolase [Chloroflexota bacterium]